MIAPSPAPRYDRIVSLVIVMLIGLTVIFLIDGNPNTLRIVLGGDLPTISVSWLLLASLVIVTSAGADVLIRSHPNMQHRALPMINLGVARFEVAPAFWILPSFSVVGPFAFFRLFSGAWQGLALALALVAAGGLLLAALIAQHYALDRDPAISQRAQTVLQAIGYLLAFGCFSAIYHTRYRTLYSATLIGATATLLSYGLLACTPASNRWRMSAVVGLMLAEVLWALNYWATSFLIAGAVLLVIFYVAVSLVHHLASGQVQRRLLVEYGVIGGGLFAVIIYAALRQ